MENLKSRAKHLIYSIELDGFTDQTGFHLNLENKKYRQADLVRLIRNSIPNFALSDSEIETFNKSGDVGEMVEEAWSRISKAKANKKGDYDEILLFILLNTFFDAPKF